MRCKTSQRNALYSFTRMTFFAQLSFYKNAEIKAQPLALRTTCEAKYWSVTVLGEILYLKLPAQIIWFGSFLLYLDSIQTSVEQVYDFRPLFIWIILFESARNSSYCVSLICSPQKEFKMENKFHPNEQIPFTQLMLTHTDTQMAHHHPRCACAIPESSPCASLSDSGYIRQTAHTRICATISPCLFSCMHRHCATAIATEADIHGALAVDKLHNGQKWWTMPNGTVEWFPSRIFLSFSHFAAAHFRLIASERASECVWVCIWRMCIVYVWPRPWRVCYFSTIFIHLRFSFHIRYVAICNIPILLFAGNRKYG